VTCARLRSGLGLGTDAPAVVVGGRYPAGKCPTFGVKKSAAAAPGSAHIRRICIILLIDDARRMCQIGHISAIR